MPQRSFLTSVQSKRALRFYRAQNSAWLWLGLATIISAITWFINPELAAQKSAIGKQLHGVLDDAWTLFTAIGGSLILYGVWRFKVKFEIIGHLIFTTAIVTNVMAILVIYGPISTALILFGVSFASAWRAWYLWTLAKGADFS